MLASRGARAGGRADGVGAVVAVAAAALAVEVARRGGGGGDERVTFLRMGGAWWLSMRLELPVVTLTLLSVLSDRDVLSASSGEGRPQGPSEFNPIHSYCTG